MKKKVRENDEYEGEGEKRKMWKMKEEGAQEICERKREKKGGGE